MKTLHMRRYVLIAILASGLSLVPGSLRAQGGQRGQGGRGQAAPPANAKASALADLTGQWVSLVTEDWRFRMVTPPARDYAGVPLNPEGRKIADNWDPAKDEAAGEQCKSYGAPAIMRVPGRIRISWADDDTLKIETDAGRQTRMLYFKQPASKSGDWQGVSEASWMSAGARGPAPAGGAAAQRGPGTLKVGTTKMRSGYLRKNGIPYSDKAIVTEYIDRTDQPNGDTYLVFTTVVEDPMYLNQPFITTSHIKKENDQSGWNPAPCTAR